MNKAREIECVDLFCGVGGLTHGLHRAGVDVIAGVDIDPASRYPYEQNNEAKFIEQDVSKFTANDVRKLFTGNKKTLLAGCAPCQPFSTYSQSTRKKKADERWSLLESFGMLVRDVRPDYVTMENVPQLLDHEVFLSFLSYLKGYSVDYGIVECEKYGIAQTRKRLVLIASKSEEVSFDLVRKQQVGEQKSIRDIIGHLPSIEAGNKGLKDPIHISSNLSPLNMSRIKASKPGGHGETGVLN